MTGAERAGENPRTDALAFLSSAAAAYEDEHFAPRCRSIGLEPESVTTASDDAFLRLFFRHYGFNRAGGARAGYPTTAVDALDAVGEIDPEALWEAFAAGCEERGVGVNERVTRGVVQETATLVNEHGNLIAWVGETVDQTDSIEPAYETIRGITGVGEKIARFFLRDAVWLTGVEPQVSADEAQYLHPMDVWTRRVTRVLWPTLEEASDTVLSTALATACGAAGESHTAVNQGAWFYPAKRLDGRVERLKRELEHRR